MLIDRDNRLPLYIQLKDLIIEKIENGEWKRGEVLPTEMELQKTLEVSRTTVRQALTELVFEGILERKQGKGTYVADEKYKPTRPGITGFTKDIEMEGHTTNSIVITEKMVTDANVARQLNINPERKILRLERIRLVNGIPIGYHDTFLNIDLTPKINLKKYNFASESLYSALESEGVIIGDSAETLEAAIPSQKHTEILKIDNQTPVLKINRVARLENGIAYEFSKMVYRSDKYKYSINLKQ
ncbi:GntR family transcriptional regulator [Pseudogracilibacillus sp. SO30301A]|uniref:GntR family transcriptional regulator n=1 Tax=Pseudogracilibacillus sp. SO30301A TaxID=3098291 RepID=UPI00300E2C04